MVLNVKALAVFFLTAAFLSAAPQLSLSTSSVGPVNITPGVNGPNQTVQALNTGTGSLNLTASASASWLSASVGSVGSCSGNNGNCYSVIISLNTASLAAGTYTEFITLTDPNAIDSPQDISVTVNTSGVQSSLTAYVTPTGGTSPTALFNVFTTGTGVHGTATTQSGGNWLQFLSGTGGIIVQPAPWLIQVAAQVGQAPGTYTGAVVISGSSAPTDNKTVNVTMVVTSAPIIQLNNTSTIRLVGSQSDGIQYAIANLNNIGGGTLSITGATGSASFLTATVSGNSLTIAANPAGLSTGVHTGSIQVASNAANNAQISIPVELVVAPAGQPAILTGGIVNIATYAQEALAAGDIAAIYGSQFAASGTYAVASTIPLPTSLGGAQVLVNGVPAPLYFVSPGQINFQVPYSLTSSQVNTVQVVAGSSPGNTRSILINAASPRLLTKYTTYGAILNSSDNTLAIPASFKDPVYGSHPATPGSVIVAYAIGLGQTTPAAVAGQPANNGSSGNPLQTVSNVIVTFGGGFSGRATTSVPAFVGLTPGLAGLYQINVAVPPDVAIGPAIPVSLIVNGAESNPQGTAAPVNIAISPSSN